MKRNYLYIFQTLYILLYLSGCSFLTQQNPFSDVRKLGVILTENESVTIPSTNGSIIVKYISPTKRQIIWHGESREIKLLKSTQINGIYHPNALFDRPIANIRGVDYAESTEVIYSDEEEKKSLDTSSN